MSTNIRSLLLIVLIGIITGLVVQGLIWPIGYFASPQLSRWFSIFVGIVASITYLFWRFPPIQIWYNRIYSEYERGSQAITLSFPFLVALVVCYFLMILHWQGSLLGGSGGAILYLIFKDKAAAWLLPAKLVNG